MPGSADATAGSRRRTVAPARARPRSLPEDDRTLSARAVRAIDEGRADHTAGRTFSLAEIKKALGIAPGGSGRYPEESKC